jgi:soluble lytic murein transglycosylase-like protein
MPIAFLWWMSVSLMQDPVAIRAAMRPALDQQKAANMHQWKGFRLLKRRRVAAFSSPILPAAGSCEPISEMELSPLVAAVARAENLDPALVLEVARQESGFKPCAVSTKGAQGVMQLMPATQIQFGVGDPFDPISSLAAGAKLLRNLLDRYNGDLKLALSAYNSGPETVDQAGGVPDIPETRNYVMRILARLPK